MLTQKKRRINFLSNDVSRFLMPFLETTFWGVFLMSRILRKSRKTTFLRIAPKVIV
jgi:hypothetical protein